MTSVRRKVEALDGFMVASAKVGDRRALDLLVRQWDPKLRAHAWRLLGNPEQAREAVQDSWIEIVRGIGRLHDPAAFPAWAYRIVSRRCARMIGGIQQRRRFEADLEAGRTKRLPRALIWTG